MRVQEIPLHRRPREVIHAQGASDMPVASLVAALLGSGGPGYPVMELGREVERVLRTGLATPESLSAIKGIGPSKAAVICAALELGRRLEGSDIRSVFSTAEDVFRACRDIVSLPQENLVVFYLNVRNQSVGRETVSIGTVSASLIHPREVFRPAILNSASGIILAHNHPSGSVEPSAADKEATRRVARAGNELGIPLLDHVICAARGCRSLRNDFPELFS